MMKKIMLRQKRLSLNDDFLDDGFLDDDFPELRWMTSHCLTDKQNERIKKFAHLKKYYSSKIMPKLSRAGQPKLLLNESLRKTVGELKFSSRKILAGKYELNKRSTE